MLYSVISALLLSTASATFVPKSGFSSHSKAGQRLLSNARKLNDQDQDMTWVANYSIKYVGCLGLMATDREGGGGPRG